MDVLFNAIIEMVRFFDEQEPRGTLYWAMRDVGVEHDAAKLWADNCPEEWLPKAKIEPPHIDLTHFNEFIERAKADGEKAMEWLKEQIK